MKLKVKVQPEYVIDEQPTPDEFDDDAYMGEIVDVNPRRRSLQVSIPDVMVIILVHIMARIVGISFSVIIRELLKPYLEVVTLVLADEGLLNEYGNIIHPPDKIYLMIEEDRAMNIRLLRSFITKAKQKGLAISWVNSSSL